MRKYLLLFSSYTFLIASCDSNRSSTSNNIEVNKEVVGAYVRDYSFEVKNMSTDQVVGIRNIRDTIFIKEKENGFEVRNAKYRMDENDQEGWISIGGTEKLPTFQATFDQSDSSLIPFENHFVSPVYLDLNNKVLYKNNDREHPYYKVK